MNQTNLKYQFARLNIAEKIIVINVVVFLLVRLLTFLLQLQPWYLERWFELPRGIMDFLVKPWTLVTYAFLHGGIWHIFFNMLLLYYVARIFFNYFGPRRFINVYFLGVMLGGAFFLLAYNLFPAFYGSQSPLIGASAGVMAVLIFICTYIPQQEVRVIFFNVKLWHIGVFFVLLDLVFIPLNDNAGGRIAHLGGALLGYLYARKSLEGKDMGAGFSRLLDQLGDLFKRDKKARMKTVYKKQQNTASAKVDYEKETRQRKIDKILDKISKGGYNSLTAKEKELLFKMSNKK